jgi:hypothetical protein
LAHETQNRLSPAQHPQTNGKVECVKGRTEEALLSHHFRSGEGLETTLQRCVLPYNPQRPE